MAIHSSILAWEIPWTEEPGGLQSMGLQRSMPHSSYIQTCSGYLIKFFSSMGFPESSAGKESTCNAGDPGLISGLGRSAGDHSPYWRLPTSVFVGFPCDSAVLFSHLYGEIWASLIAQLVKNPPAMRETWVRSLGWEDPLEKGKKGYPLQHSGLENSTDCIVHGVAKSWTWLSDFHFHISLSLVTQSMHLIGIK